MHKYHPRTEDDFRITSVSWEIDIQKRHEDAGFAAISKEIALRRFYQFIRFLQNHGMTARIILNSLSEVTDQSELRNSDLNDKGFYFVQRYHGRWLNRVRNDKGERKEEDFLNKWNEQYENEQKAV